MVALAMTGSVIGFVLGLRFKVMVLLPVEVAALLAAALVAVSAHVGWTTVLIGFVMFSISSQVSYAISLTLPLLWRPRAV